ncbi:MAG: riboflavin synthase [Candidatus Magasanikbacteria bacterium]|nr:riboflavin synthase [Candidatus Magasanikbacteria bacterium]
MFTGIVTEVGEVGEILSEEGWTRLTIVAPETSQRVVVGSSVAVSGVCLTANVIDGARINFSLLPQTLAVTNIGSWHTGTRVNLESALRVGDELGGHFVYGHVDGLARVVDITQEGESVRIRFELSEELMCHVAPKGSIAIDGVSLTIATLGENWIEVALVEYTLAHTTLGELRVDDVVHIENDMLMKFIAKQNIK